MSIAKMLPFSFSVTLNRESRLTNHKFEDKAFLF